MLLRSSGQVIPNEENLSKYLEDIINVVTILHRNIETTSPNLNEIQTSLVRGRSTMTKTSFDDVAPNIIRSGKTRIICLNYNIL